ncbi:hypothetical protein [Lacticaseibacillus porcinae]|uniref:hypothetical protein n=1 Tax=Lacticaseibacillus porcinae TaxID=1123687 RepID=UPI000F7B2ACB|nr:hypothetical protein [Lacticaseibacillus porcinae]
MKFHEFAKMPFPDTVLAEFLHIGLPTLKKLRDDVPLSANTLKNIGHRLQLSDPEILTQLTALDAIKREPPTTLDVTKLTVRPNHRMIDFGPVAGDLCCSCRLVKSHQLIVTPIVASSQLEKRVNHALYQDHWQKYSPCPLASLTADDLDHLLRSIFHKQQPLTVMIDREYFTHNFVPFVSALLPYLQTGSVDQTMSVFFDRDALPGDFTREYLLNQRVNLQRFTQARQFPYLQMHTILRDQSLTIQAAQLVALAVQKLPLERLKTDHIRLLSINEARKSLIVKQYLAFEKRRH